MSPQDAATGTVKAMAGIDTAGNFDSQLIVEHWAPVVVWTVVDNVLKRFGAWRKMGTMLRM
jgi:hypothetical protein